ncbi:MAG: TetR/AcrR family transcriptional regulator [Bryobacterales bacterium]|nr:TetR/AcrR family transcriptional regulator [Bryobacterales bacterium]
MTGNQAASARTKGDPRQAILQNAAELFAEAGYQNFSMRKLAGRIGVSPGTIYNYFEDKDALLDAICVQAFQKLGERQLAIPKAHLDPLQALRIGMLVYIQFGMDYPAHYAATFQMEGEIHKRSDVVSQKELIGRNCFSGLIEAVQRAADAGLLVDKPAEEIAQAIWAASHGVVGLLTNARIPFLLTDRLAANTVELVLRGIQKNPEKNLNL